MNVTSTLQAEIKGSCEFFLDFTNLRPGSPGYGLTVDNTRNRRSASIASTGFALSAWVIAAERGHLGRREAVEITRGTLDTLLNRASHYHGFFAHFLDIDHASRLGRCEYSTIDTALCLNGVITAAAYFQDAAIQEMADRLLDRVDWDYIVFRDGSRTLFHMSYNPDQDGDYVDNGEPGFISRWDMAAEQKMMYLQAAARLDPVTATELYAGFCRDTRLAAGEPVIINPGGNLSAYQLSEAWLDTARWLDPEGIDWFHNTRLACQANRQFCIEHAGMYRTYHARSWGLAPGDSPKGYDVFGSEPCLHPPHHNGTVSIYSALAALPFIPAAVMEMIDYLLYNHSQTWGRYGFYDAYNLAVQPAWYSTTLYGIDKGCSLLMIENYLSRLIWNVYTNSPVIQNALKVLGFTRRTGD